MEHAQTIAMATDLLADGRAEDVAQMVDPLLETVDAPTTNTGQLLLHAVRAQIEIVHRDRPQQAANLLPPLSKVRDSCTCVRAEISLWRGWTHARLSRDPSDPVRGLHLLTQAEELFDGLHDPRGRCWANLGQAQAYFHLAEYTLMRRALADADPLVEKLDDRQAQRWLHELSIPAQRFAGRYDVAERHLQTLRALGRTWNDRRIRGHATAHEAALRYDLGQSPTKIASTAETAEALLRQVDSRAHYPLLAAYHAHIGSLLRSGHWDEVFTILDEAQSSVRDTSTDWVPLQTLRARIALQRDNLSTAEDVLTDLLEQAHRLPHGVHWSPLALLRGEVLAEQNRLDDAYTWMERAHRNARESGHRGNQLRTLLMMARTAAARGDLDAARAHLEAADEYDDYFSVLPFAVRRFSAEGAIAQSANQTADATDAYRHALAAASMMQDRYRTASLQLALAQLEGKDRAHALASAAHATFDAIHATKEAEIATAMADGASPPTEDASSLPHPASSPSDSTLATTLERASLAVPLVANAWLQMAAAHLPHEWIGVYRISTDGISSLLNEHGRRPNELSSSTGAPADIETDTVEWVRLRPTPPTLCLGIEQDNSDGDAARSQLQSWLPLLRLALERALLHQQQARSTPSEESLSSIPVDGFIAESESMQSLIHKIDRIRCSHRPVLIAGESGAGKQLLAQAVHETSDRSEGPLRHVACANMQREPLPERLFGHVDADGTRTLGAVHEADGGTLLIEDVDALPVSAQDSLLHLLETGEVVPEGGTESIPVDVRVLATTDAQLDEKVRNDHFRPALHEHLSVLSLRMPPLRERRADIPLLVHHFLDTLRSDRLKNAAEAPVTQPAMEALLRYDWPGNVRQLRNELERALLHVENEPVQVIDRDVLLDQIVENARSSDAAAPTNGPDAILHPDETLNDILSQTEATVIERVLQACEGQVTASAEVLGLSRQGLYKKMKRLGIDASDFQPDSQPATAS